MLMIIFKIECGDDRLMQSMKCCCLRNLNMPVAPGACGYANDIASHSIYLLPLSIILFAKRINYLVLEIEQPVRNIDDFDSLVLICVVAGTGNDHLGVSVLDLQQR